MGRIMLKNVRLSYCHVWEKASICGSEEKYSCAILIRKDDFENVKKLENAVNGAIAEGINKFWQGKKPVNLKLPLRDGDAEKPGDPDYAGMYWINANSKIQPKVVDAKVQPILDRELLYSGCYANVSVSIYPFSGTAKGVACGLGNIQKVKDGPRLDGNTNPEDEFEEFDDMLG